MQRLPPAGWSRHHLVYHHRCACCSPNLNPSEYTHPASQLSSPLLSMPKPVHFLDPNNNSTINLKKAHHRISANDSINDSIRVASPVSDRESISITINDEKSEKEVKLEGKKSPMRHPPWWKKFYWGLLTILNIYSLIG